MKGVQWNTNQIGPVFEGLQSDDGLGLLPRTSGHDGTLIHRGCVEEIEDAVIWWFLFIAVL